MTFSRSSPDFAGKKYFFRLSKSANFVKNFATNPEVHQFCQISSKINIFRHDGQFLYMMTSSLLSK